MTDRKGQGKATGPKLKFSDFKKRNLHVEQELQIPDALSQYTDNRIAQRGWGFLARELVTMNASWTREFYVNYYNAALDIVHLRGQKISVIEETIERILHFLPRPNGKDGFEEA
ncbi:hypothetical protein AHAS_Ahas13G0157500 [Arachis hypogaea]